jgi:hypothetical protein
MQMHDHDYWMSLHVSPAFCVEIVYWMSDWNSFKGKSSLKVICAWIKFKVRNALHNTEYNYTKQCGCSEQFVHLIVLLCVLLRGEKFTLQHDYVCGRRKGSRHWEKVRCVAFFAHSKGEGRKERKKERSGTFT